MELDPTVLQERYLVDRPRLARWIAAGEHNGAALARQPEQSNTLVGVEDKHSEAIASLLTLKFQTFDNPHVLAA